MIRTSHSCDVLVIGGGPAGASVARQLVWRGYRVIVASRPSEERRGIAESLPPSAHRVLSALGLLEVVLEGAPLRAAGNAVWWGREEGRLEDFRGAEGAGLQIWRPAFDRVLARQAVSAGVRWLTGNVVRVETTNNGAITALDLAAGAADVHSRFVVDASGRSGVLSRKRRRAARRPRTHAWIGTWDVDPARADSDARTLVETADDFWIWSVPITAASRSVTVMIDPDRTEVGGSGPLAHRYVGLLAKARHVPAIVERGSLRSVWGCDASTYDTTDPESARHYFVGDARSFIDPLSSAGIKKALTSAWMAASVINTCLRDPALGPPARTLFALREREAYAASVRLSADYARQALAHHGSSFWECRAAVDPALSDDVAEPIGRAEVAAAFGRLHEHPDVELAPAAGVRVEWQPAFQQDRVALEPAIVTGLLGRPVRFVDNVDLTRVLALTRHQPRVGPLFESYCAETSPVPLPGFLKALAVLIAARALELRPADP